MAGFIITMKITHTCSYITSTSLNDNYAELAVK